MKKILIVDDTEIDMIHLNNLLIDFVSTQKSIKITRAENLIQAKQHLAETRFDLVMLDGKLGSGRFGYDLIPDVLKNNPDCKIVMCSSNYESNEEGIRLGAHAYVDKNHIFPWTDKNESHRKQMSQVILKFL